jgi:hypothetical protein
VLKFHCSTWTDVSGERHFSAHFYADLLAYMGASMVVWLDKLDTRKQDAAAFEEQGLAVCTLEDLGCTDPSERFSLQTISRFVEVCRYARGPVAVCGDDRLAYTLLTAYMLRSGLFADAAEAVSWICIARGAAVAPDYSVLAGRPAGHVLRKTQSLGELEMGGAAAADSEEWSDRSPIDIVAAAGRWGAGPAAVGPA